MNSLVRRIARRYIRASDTYYHGTSTEHLNSIQSEGLIPSPPEERWGDVNLQREGPDPKSFDGVYLIDNGPQARRIAAAAAQDFGGNPLVAIVEVESREGVAIDNDYITTASRKAIDDWIRKEIESKLDSDVKSPRSFALGYLLSGEEHDQIVYGRSFLEEVHDELSLSGDLNVDPWDVSGELARDALLVMLASMADPQGVSFSYGVMAQMGHTAEEVERMGDRGKRNVRYVVEQTEQKWPLSSNPQKEWDDVVLRLGKHYGSQRMEGEDSILIPETIDYSGSNRIVALLELRGLDQRGDLTEDIDVIAHHGSAEKYLDDLGIPTDMDSVNVTVRSP